jgi:iron complex outermembrane receptor protein
MIRPFVPLRLIAVLVVAGTVPSRAQLAPPTLLPKYEITGERDRQQALLLDAAQRRVSQVAGGTQVLGTEEFREGRAANFQDFLQHATGVYVASDNAGEASKISMRGSGIQADEALGVQILLGGIAYNQADGEANLDEIDLAAVQGAEVYRGADALRFGNYVLGGAINLIPRTGRDSPGVRVTVEGGSFGYYRGSIGAGSARGDGDAYVAFSQRKTKGWREHSGEDSRILTGNLGFKVGATGENRLYLGYSEWNRMIPGDVTLEDLEEERPPAFDEAVENDIRHQTRSVRLSDRIVFSNSDRETEAGVILHHRRFHLFDRYERDMRQGVTDSYSNNLGLLLSHAQRGTLAGHANSWLLGTAPVYESENSRNFRNRRGLQDNASPTASSFTRAINLPVFFENTFAATNGISIVTGAQYARVERNFEDRFWSDNDGDQSARLTINGFNPKLGVLYRRTPEETWFANVSRSFQPPSFDDLNPFESGTNGSVIFTPLEAQKAWTFEVGGRGQRGPIEWEVSVYHSWVRHELFETNDNLGHDLGTINVPNTRHQGVELGLEIELLKREKGAPRLTLRQQYTLNDFRFRNDPVYGNNRIAGIPVHLYQAELTYRHPSGFYFGGELDSSLGGFWADQANTLKTGTYAITGLKAGFHGHRFSVFVEGRNLSDRRYAAMVKPIGDARVVDDEELMVFAPGLPRTIYGGVSFAW